MGQTKKINYRTKNKIKKILAITLAGIILTEGNLVYGFNGFDNLKKVISKSNFSLNAKFPIMLGGIGGVLAGCLICSKKTTGINKINRKNANDIIENMSPEDIKINLKDQIKKFENIGQGYFKVDYSFLKEYDKIYCLHTMLALNDAFEKYPGFTNELIKIKKQQKSTFRIFASNDNINNQHIQAQTANDFSGIQFAIKNKNYKEFYESYFYENNKETKSISDVDKLLGRVAIHELGHVFEYIVEKASDTSTKLIATKMKEAVIKIARKKYGNQNYKVGRYGDTNESEWLAEVFSHLICSLNPNSLGKALDDYLKEIEKNGFVLYYNKGKNSIKPLEDKIL